MVWDAVSPAFLSSTQDAVSASPLVSQLVSHLVFQPAKRKLKMNSKVRFLQLFGVYSFFFGPVQICYKAGGRKHWEPMRGQSIEALGICTENPKDRKETDH